MANRERLLGIIEDLIIARLRYERGEIKSLDYLAEVQTLEQEFKQIMREMMSELERRIERLEKLPHNMPKDALIF